METETACLNNYLIQSKKDIIKFMYLYASDFPASKAMLIATK